MADNITTADGLLESGWYPGKKHGFLKNLGRVASWGIYSPDNRMATQLNIDRMHEQNRAEVDNKRQIDLQRGLHQLAFDTIRDAYAKANPDKSPEEIMHMAANVYANKFQAEEQGYKTKRAEGELSERRAVGALPLARSRGLTEEDAAIAEARARSEKANSDASRTRGGAGGQFTLGASEVEAKTNAEKARALKAANDEAYEQEATRLGLPQRQTAHDLSQVNDDIEKRRLEADTRAHQFEVEKATRSATMQNAINQANERLAQGQNQAKITAATGRALDNLTTADSVATAQLNKAGSLAVPFGGTVYPVVPPATEPLTGQDHNPESTTIDIIPDPLNPGKTIQKVRRKQYGVSTADPAPQAPGRTFTPEEFNRIMSSTNAPAH